VRFGSVLATRRREAKVEVIAIVDKQFANSLRMVYAAFTEARRERSPNPNLNPNPNPNRTRKRER